MFFRSTKWTVIFANNFENQFALFGNYNEDIQNSNRFSRFKSSTKYFNEFNITIRRRFSWVACILLRFATFSTFCNFYLIFINHLHPVAAGKLPWNSAQKQTISWIHKERAHKPPKGHPCHIMDRLNVHDYKPNPMETK